MNAISISHGRGHLELAMLAHAIERSIARSGDAHVAIIPEGPYVVPRYAA